MGLKRSREDSVSSSEAPDSPFAREPSAEAKIVHLDVETAISDEPAVMKCSLPPHQPLRFASFDEYDVHYQKTHVNRCSECHKNFPDEHFLHLHIAENHDPISAARRDRGEKIYQCLLPTCDRPCSTPQKRRLHCIDKHNFPRNYDFYIVNDGIDRRSSMLRPPHRRRSSTVNSTTSAGGMGRRRGESSASLSVGMDIVKDGDEEEDDDGEDDDDENDDDDEDEEKTPKQVKRTPITLHGRGGFFGRARGTNQVRGRGRGRGYGRGTASSALTPPAAPTIAQAPSPPATTTDPISSLTSSMSALQFIPPSVRLAREKARSGAPARS